MATQQTGPLDYLALGLERSLDTITRGRAEDRARQEKISDVDAERKFKEQQIAQEIALRKSLEENRVTAQAEAFQQAAEERAALQTERLSERMETAEQIANQRREDSAWRELESAENRRARVAQEARAMRQNAIQTGALPSLADFRSLGMTEDEAASWASGTMTARQDYERSPEFLEQRRLRDAQIRASEALTTQRGETSPADVARTKVLQLMEDRQSLMAQPASPERDSLLSNVNRGIAEWQAIATRESIVASGTDLGVQAGQYRGTAITTPISGGATPGPAPRGSGAGGGIRPAPAAPSVNVDEDPGVIAARRKLEEEQSRIEAERLARPNREYTPADLEAAQKAKAAIDAAAEAARLRAAENALSGTAREFIRRTRAGLTMPQWIVSGPKALSETRQKELLVQFAGTTSSTTPATSGSRGRRPSNALGGR